MEISVRPSRTRIDWQRVESFGLTLKHLRDGAVLKIDRAVYLDGSVVLTGWCSKSIQLRIAKARLNQRYDRADLSGVVGDDINGFLIVCDLEERAPVVDLFISHGDINEVTVISLSSDVRQAERILNEQVSRIHLLFPLLVAKQSWRPLFNALTSTERPSSISCAIDGVATVGNVGLVMTGWVVGPQKVNYWLVAGGMWRSLDDTIRLERDDVAGADDHDPHVMATKGFYTCFAGAFSKGDEVALIAVGPGTICIVAAGSAAITHDDPIKLSKLLFALAPSPTTFAERLERNEGAALSALIEQRAAGWSDDCELDLRFGDISEDCDISVIVPLYKRWDFVEHQLAAFSGDADFRSRIELLYVIDDPGLVEVLKREAALLYELYRVPFRIIWGGLNRGYSGANNFGAANASGDTLILLNSDVFPSKPGWASGLAELLRSNPDYGIVAPRLVYPNGSIQHAGMAFQYEPEFSIWVNKHPLAGLPVAADTSQGLEERWAVTGACMAISSEDFWAADGFDTGYLIGDFEDSDLCLKIKAAGKRIGYSNDFTLTHLERQSFGSIGEGGYRQMVVIFNAWRHFNRWKYAILASAGQAGEDAPTEEA
jgi:GT2 family glycosyltransferase